MSKLMFVAVREIRLSLSWSIGCFSLEISTCSSATQWHWSQPVYHRFPWFPFLNSHLKLPHFPLQDSPRGRRHLLFVFCPLAAEDGQRRRWVCQEVLQTKPHGGFGKAFKTLNLCVLSPLRCTGVWAAGLQSLWDAGETRRFLLHHHAEHWRWETFFFTAKINSISQYSFFAGKIY